MKHDIRYKAVVTSQLDNKMLFELLREEPDIFRWHYAPGQRWNGVFIEETRPNAPSAISLLRHHIETEPGWKGCDLTIIPVAPPPEERAASAIVEGRAASNALIEALIREHTNASGLADAAVAMLTYFVDVLKNTDPIASRLMFNVLVELEKTQATSYAGIKKLLSTPPAKVDTSTRIIIPGRNKA